MNVRRGTKRNGCLSLNGDRDCDSFDQLDRDSAIEPRWDDERR